MNSSGNNGSKGSDGSAQQPTKIPTVLMPGSQGSPITADFELKIKVQQLLSSVDTDKKMELGYSLSDLIAECHFAGTNCSETYVLLHEVTFWLCTLKWSVYINIKWCL